MNDVRDIIKSIMVEQNVSNAQLADRINRNAEKKVSNAAIWDRLNNSHNKSMSVSTALEMLNALNYKLIIVPDDKNVKGGIEL